MLYSMATHWLCVRACRGMAVQRSSTWCVPPSSLPCSLLQLALPCWWFMGVMSLGADWHCMCSQGSAKTDLFYERKRYGFRKR